MDMVVAWNGTLDRQAIAAQQKPAPVVPREGLPLFALLMAVFEAQPLRHWTARELHMVTGRRQNTIDGALRVAVADGRVQRIKTGLSSQVGAPFRFALVQRANGETA